MKPEIIRAVLELGEWPEATPYGSKVKDGSYVVRPDTRVLYLVTLRISPLSFVPVCSQVEFNATRVELLQRMPEGATHYRMPPAMARWYLVPGGINEAEFHNGDQWVESDEYKKIQDKLIALDKLRSASTSRRVAYPPGKGTHCMVSSPWLGDRPYECIILSDEEMLLNRDPESPYWDIVKRPMFSHYYPVPDTKQDDIEQMAEILTKRLPHGVNPFRFTAEALYNAGFGRRR